MSQPFILAQKLTEKVQLILQLLYPYTFIPTSTVIREMRVKWLCLSEKQFSFVMKNSKDDSYTGGIFSCLVSNFKLELQELR